MMLIEQNGHLHILTEVYSPDKTYMQITEELNSRCEDTTYSKQVVEKYCKHLFGAKPEVRSYMYTPEQISYLLSLKDCSYEEMIKLFNSKFHTNKSVDAIGSAYRKYLGQKNSCIQLTVQQIEWLKAQSTYITHKELTQKFNCKFQCDVSVYQIKRQCKKLGLHRTRNGRTRNTKFVWTDAHIQFLRQFDGQAITYEELTQKFNIEFDTNISSDTLRYQFQKLNMHLKNRSQYKSGCMPVTTRPIGSTKIKDGVEYIKYRNLSAPKKSFETNWMPMCRYKYIEYHGSIPENHRIIFLDGNNRNYSKDNLYAFPNDCVGALHKHGWHKIEDVELKLAALRTCELEVTVNQLIRKSL